MATLKQLKDDRIKITSKILKKDEDFIPISPKFIKDLRDKTLLENSALKLSISDYKLMCRKDKVLNMMAVALNKPKAKLKKFCKYMSVFEENISKSSKSIANKINGINGPITKLPENIRSTILDKFAEILPSKYVLLDWIDKDKLNWDSLCLNPNAIDLLKENIRKSNIHWKFISSNPNAIDLLLDNKHKINWFELCKNPSAIDLIKERIEYENNLTKEEYNDLEHYEKINWCWLSLNPNAIKILEHNLEKLNWCNLSRNPNAIKLLEKKQNEIDWESLSSNPNAIELLTNNQNKIDWESLSSNPNAIKLLKKRIEFEHTLTEEDLYDLDLEDRISWINLSKNPNVIDFLEKNQDKIYWFSLSSNPNAINLIKERIEYESTLTPKQYNNLTRFNKINWCYLSANPNAIDLLKNNKAKIDWDKLSSNPAIFKAV